MSHRVAAFYQFAALPDFRELREPLRAICAELRLKGSVLLAHAGITGTLAGSAEGIAALVEELQRGALFGGRLDNLELKYSHAAAMPFQRLKIRLKKEIVTLGYTEADPTRQVGIYVDPADWNALIATADTLVIDTRNAFEVAMGTFPGAVDPGIQSFGQFKDFAARHRDPPMFRGVEMARGKILELPEALDAGIDSTRKCAHRHLELIAGVDHQRVRSCDQRVPVGGVDIDADLPRRIGLRVAEGDDLLFQPDLETLKRHRLGMRVFQFEVVEPAAEQRAALQFLNQRGNSLGAAGKRAVDAFVGQQHAALQPEFGADRAQRLAQLPEIRQRGELIEGGDPV